MRVKGDLESIGLADLFQTLSDMRASGVLFVKGEIGEKQIALMHGEITVTSIGVGERPRLGELLVTRGKVTEEKLQEAIEAQKKDGGKLGEILTKRGLVRPEDITEVIRFQVEEEICDLFTWKQAAFDFRDNIKPGEVEESAGESIRLSIDPRALILEAARRMEEWKAIERRLPTPFLAFKLTAKGEQSIDRAPTALKRVMMLLREGRTLETVVKRSCLGRFSVCKGVIHLLDQGCIFPYPVQELRYLASEHRVHRRYEDALNLYRRLQQATDDPAEKEDLSRLIMDTLRAIEDAKKRGEAGIEAEGISYQEAAKEFKRKATLHRVAGILLAGALVIGAMAGVAVYLQRQHKRSVESYQDVLAACQQHVTNRRYIEAIRVWERYVSELEDKEGEQGRNARAQKDRVSQEYAVVMRARIDEVVKLEKQRKYREALELTDRICLEEYASPSLPEVEQIASRLRAILERETTAEKLAAAARKLEQAQGFEQEKRHTDARAAFEMTLRMAPPSSNQAREAQEGLNRISDIENRALGHFQIALEFERQGKPEQAMAEYALAQSEWRDCRWALSAKDHEASIRGRIAKAKIGLETAKRLRDGGRNDEAIAEYRRLMIEFGDLQAIQPARDALNELSSSVGKFEDLLADARAAWAKGNAAVAVPIFARILTQFPNDVSSRELTIPVSVESTPPAEVLLDDKAKGTTPLALDVPAGRPFQIVLRRRYFASKTIAVSRLRPEDLTVRVSLDRSLSRSVPLPAPLLCRPRMEGKCVLCAEGLSVALRAPLDLRPVESLQLLQYAASHKRPDGRDEMVPNDFWHLRALPATYPGGFAVGTRNRKLCLLTRDLRPATEILLPAEVTGAVAYELVKLTRKEFVFASGADGKLYAVDLAAGEVAWSAQVGKTCTYGPVVVPDGVVGIGDDGALVKAAQHSGVVKWSLSLNSPLAAEPAAGQFGGVWRAYLPLDNSAVAAVDLDTGKEIFRHEESRFKPVALSASPNMILISAEDGRLRRLSPTNQVVWTKTLEGPALPPVIAGDGLCVATRVGALYWIHPDTGAILWRFRAQEEIASCAILDKRILLSTVKGNALLLDLDN